MSLKSSPACWTNSIFKAPIALILLYSGQVSVYKLSFRSKNGELCENYNLFHFLPDLRQIRTYPQWDTTLYSFHIAVQDSQL